MTRLAESAEVLIVLSFLYPATYLLQRNSHLYQSAQLELTFAFVALVAVAVALAVSRLLRRLPMRARRAAMTALGTGIVLTLLYSSIGGFINDRAVLVCGYLLTITLGGVIGYLRGTGVHVVALAVLVLINGAVAVVHAVDEAADGGSAGQQQSTRVFFRQKPNVYLLVLESYNSLDVRREVYGIDNAPLLRALQAHGLTIHDHVYANYWATLFSLSAVFSMRQHYYANSVDIADGGHHRKVIGGILDNKVLDTFVSNGYAIDYSQFNPALYHPGPQLDRYEPQPLLQPMELFSGLYSAVYRLTSWDMWHSPAFQRLLVMPNALFARGAGRGAPLGAGRPVFTVIYTGAEHTGSDNAIDDVWIPKYRRLVAKADRALIELLDDLYRRDPNALIVLLGDHGAWRTRDRWMGESDDPNVNLRTHGASAVDATRDLFEVLLAVKWPEGTMPPGTLSPVNLFRAVFAALANGAESGEPGASNDSFAYVLQSNAMTATPHIYRTVEDGRALERWEAFQPPAAVATR